MKAENDRQIKAVQERRKRMAKKMFGAYFCLLEISILFLVLRMNSCKLFFFVIVMMVIMSNMLCSMIWTKTAYNDSTVIPEGLLECASLYLRSGTSVHRVAEKSTPLLSSHSKSLSTVIPDKIKDDFEDMGEIRSLEKKESQTIKLKEIRLFSPLIITQNGSRLYKATLLYCEHCNHI